MIDMRKNRFTIRDVRISDHERRRLYDLNTVDGVISVYKLLNEVSEENEQLKQEIENLKITINARETLIDVCEKKFNEMGYIITVDDDGYVIE